MFHGNTIKGVYSKSEKTPIKQADFPEELKDFEGKTKYSEWQFIMVPEAADAAEYHPAPAAANKANTDVVRTNSCTFESCQGARPGSWKRAHRILFNEQTIEQRVTELAQDISRDYAGKDVVAVCILKGALVFFTDLVRRITIPVTIELIQASSYGSGTVSSKNLAISKDSSTDIRGKHVLLIDTIIDTGETMAGLLKRFSEQGPASLAIVGLLDKRPRRIVEVPITYKGFEIPDLFVVGYGMDRGEKYRNLPYIAVIEDRS